MRRGARVASFGCTLCLWNSTVRTRLPTPPFHFGGRPASSNDAAKLARVQERATNPPKAESLSSLSAPTEAYEICVHTYLYNCTYYMRVRTTKYNYAVHFLPLPALALQSSSVDAGRKMYSLKYNSDSRISIYIGTLHTTVLPAGVRSACSPDATAALFQPRAVRDDPSHQVP